MSVTLCVPVLGIYGGYSASNDDHSRSLQLNWGGYFSEIASCAMRCTFFCLTAPQLTDPKGSQIKNPKSNFASAERLGSHR
jgi:hypothetical protein